MKILKYVFDLLKKWSNDLREKINIYKAEKLIDKLIYNDNQLTSEANYEKKREALRSLVSMGECAVEPLIRSLNRHFPDIIRNEIEEALGKMKTGENITEIATLLWKTKVNCAILGFSPDGSYISAGDHFFNKDGEHLPKSTKKIIEFSQKNVFQDGIKISSNSNDILFFNEKNKLIWRFTPSSFDDAFKYHRIANVAVSPNLPYIGLITSTKKFIMWKEGDDYFDYFYHFYLFKFDIARIISEYKSFQNATKKYIHLYIPKISTYGNRIKVDIIIDNPIDSPLSVVKIDFVGASNYFKNFEPGSLQRKLPEEKGIIDRYIYGLRPNTVFKKSISFEPIYFEGEFDFSIHIKSGYVLIERNVTIKVIRKDDVDPPQILFDTAKSLSSQAAQLFNQKNSAAALQTYENALNHFTRAHEGAKALNDTALANSISNNISSTKTNITACKNAIGAEIAAKARSQFEKGDFAGAIHTYAESLKSFEDTDLISKTKANIENCYIEIDTRKIEELSAKAESLLKEASSLTEPFKAIDTLNLADSKIKEAESIANKRRLTQTLSQLNALSKKILDQKDIVHKRLSSEPVISEKYHINPIKARPLPSIPETKSDKAQLILELTRTVYDPVDGNLISEKKLHYPEVSKWLNAHPPPDYWYILRIDNHGNTLEQWAVELETDIALSVKEAYIDGFERSLPLNCEHMQWKDKYVLRVPAQLGIPLPSNGTKRVYFRLNIDCNISLQARYTISGNVKAKDAAAPIEEKIFSFSCRIRELKAMYAKKPEKVENYVKEKTSELYTQDAAKAITFSFKLYDEINKMVEKGRYVEESALIAKLENLRASLVNVRKFTGVENPLKLVEESVTIMHSRFSTELILKRWKDMNLFDVMMTELLKGRK